LEIIHENALGFKSTGSLLLCLFRPQELLSPRGKASDRERDGRGA
jgi:hypothetical protein